MTSSIHTARRAYTAGDAAVEGLWEGIVAGIVMMAVLAVVALLAGQRPAGVMAAFAVRGNPNPVTGGLIHLATAGVYGILWGLFWRLARRRAPAPAWLAGLLYGLLLFAVSQITLAAVDSPLNSLPVLAFGLAHVAYGLALGLLAGRKRKSDLL